MSLPRLFDNHIWRNIAKKKMQMHGSLCSATGPKNGVSVGL